jgi:hypothetical protein
LHKECPEKGNTISTTKYFKCELTKMKKARRLWRHVKEKMRKKKVSQSNKTTMRRVFSTKFVTSLRWSETTQNKTSGHSHARLQRQVQPQDDTEYEK